MEQFDEREPMLKKRICFGVYLDLLSSVATVGVAAVTAIRISAISFLIYLGIATFTHNIVRFEETVTINGIPERGTYQVYDILFRI
jgi:hypothetical protein